jgi:DNA polymerase beta
MKVAIKLKKTDLRQYGSQCGLKSQATGKQLIIDVMGQLVEHVDNQVKQTVGEDKRKNQFRSTQFKKALSSLRAYEGDITSGRQAQQLPGIGKGIADRIDEILRTGTLSELSVVKTLDDRTQLITQLTTVTGIGESNANKFIEIGISSLEDLRAKVANGTVKLTHHMRVGLKYYDDFLQKIPYQEIAELGQIMKSCVTSLFPNVLVEICGSHRRKKPLSGDIDVLMTCPDIVTDDDMVKSNIRYLKQIVTTLQRTGFIIDDLTSQGDTKYMGVCLHPSSKVGHRIDIRFVSFDSFYPAILYFTGSMMLNKLMRTVALEKGYTLNEYGLYRLVTGHKEERIVVKSEKEIFEILNLVYLDPEQRDLN